MHLMRLLALTALAQSVCDTIADGNYLPDGKPRPDCCNSQYLDKAMWIAEEIEEQSHVYWGAEAIGGAVLLNDEEEMAAVNARFSSYGQ